MNFDEQENNFLESWNQIESNFEGLALYPLIRELRAKGYDRKLRAGQSMTTFSMSRLVKGFLRSNDPHITIRATENEGMKVRYLGRGFANTVYEIELDTLFLSTELEDLIQRLIDKPVDAWE